MPTTELVTLSVSQGNEKIGDPDNKGAIVMGQTARQLLSTDGCQRFHMGTAVEDPQTIRLLIDWDSLPKHQEFMASSEYPSFLANIRSIVTAKPFIYHVDFNSSEDLDAALGAPVTELVAFFFDGKVPADYSEGIERAKTAFGTPKGLKGWAWGPTHETELEYEAVKGQAAVMAFGWASVDDHMAFRDTQAFKDNIHLLRSTYKAVKMQHIQAMRAHKE